MKPLKLDFNFSPFLIQVHLRQSLEQTEQIEIWCQLKN